MLFKRQVLEGIARGKVTLAFRRWKRPQVRPGTRMRTALGAIRIGDVRLIQEASLKEDHALKAGFDNLAALKNDLREGEDRQLYSVEIAGLEEDVRALLRQDDKLDAGRSQITCGQAGAMGPCQSNGRLSLANIDGDCRQAGRSCRQNRGIAQDREDEVQAGRAQTEGTRPDGESVCRLPALA
jgi:hypothetical protein